MNKSELRAFYKAARNNLNEPEIRESGLKILEKLKTMEIWDFSVFHIFVPISQQKEINTYPIIDYLFQSGKRVVVPKVVGQRMISCEIQEDVKWETGVFNVPEPKEFREIDSQRIEVIFMPMLICDSKGNRVGYGGGFYDRFLQEVQGDALKIGLNFFAPIAEISDLKKTDIPVNYCVTSDEIVSFTS